MSKNKKISKNLRINILQLSHQAKSSHIGGCLSIVEILTILYNNILRGFSLRKKNLKILLYLVRVMPVWLYIACYTREKF